MLRSCIIKGAAFSLTFQINFRHVFYYLYIQIMNMSTKFYNTFFFAFFVFTSNTFSQKLLSEGTIKYNISIESGNGEKQISSALNGAELSLFLSKDMSRTEMKSSVGSETTVYDSKTGKGFILKEYSGQKLMITTNADNWNQKNKINKSLDFKIDENATISIAGYACKKATATSADGKSYIVYFDPTIQVLNKTYNNAFPQLRGLPVQYELQSGNLVFKYTLSKYEADAISTNTFEAPKTGFRIMTYEENQQLKKGE